MADKRNPLRRIARAAGLLCRLWEKYAEMDLLWTLRSAPYALLQLFADAVAALSATSAVWLIAARLGGIAGMSGGALLFMCGYAATVDGLLAMAFGGCNTGYISRIIGRGQLDHMLIQPVPIWAQLLTAGFVPFSGAGKLICGLALTGTAIRRLGQPATPLWLGRLAVNLLGSAGLILAVVYAVSCCAFLAPAAAEEISMTVYDLFGDVKYYPLGGLTTRGIYALCTVPPVGLAAWFPVNVLLGHPPAGLPAALTPAAAALWLAAAVWLFRKGMQYYARNGSIRYTGFGHR